MHSHMDELKKRIEDLEIQNGLQSRQLEDLHKRLKRQEKLMRMAALFMLFLFIVWLISVTWFLPS